MSLDHYVSLFSAVISFTGLLLVVLQLRDSTRQRESESLVELYDINRQLLSLGFSHPQLFAILDDAKNADPVWERYYLQMWLNQLSLSHAYLQRSVVQVELKESLERNLVDFMTLDNMRRHWQRYGTFYPTSFQKCVNEILKKVEPSETAAQVKSN
jgi:hypothetical protein